MRKHLDEVKNFVIENPTPTFGECHYFLSGLLGEGGYNEGRKALLLFGISVKALKVKSLKAARKESLAQFVKITIK